MLSYEYDDNFQSWSDEYFDDFHDSFLHDLSDSDSINDTSWSQQNNTATTNNQATPLVHAIDSSPTKFREKLYLHFTGRKDKPARKELILKYHTFVHERNLGQIRNTIREEQRDISKYFTAFANHQSLILETIIQLEKEGKINYNLDYIYLLQKRRRLRMQNSFFKNTSGRKILTNEAFFKK